MNTYYCFLDGPLQGQTIASTAREVEGQLLDVEVVDVGDRPDGATHFPYRVVTPSEDMRPGTLRYVAGAA